MQTNSVNLLVFQLNSNQTLPFRNIRAIWRCEHSTIWGCKHSTIRRFEHSKQKVFKLFTRKGRFLVRNFRLNFQTETLISKSSWKTSCHYTLYSFVKACAFILQYEYDWIQYRMNITKEISITDFPKKNCIISIYGFSEKICIFDVQDRFAFQLFFSLKGKRFD